MRRKLFSKKAQPLMLLLLENRLAPATLTVLNTGDLDGNGDVVLGSLRHRIMQANEDPDPDTINFALPGPSFVINPSSALPALTCPTLIDGASQPGFAGTPLVEVQGNGFASSYDGLFFGAPGSTLRSLIVNGFGNNGVLMSGSGNTVSNCYVGVDRTGTIAVPNGWGIRMDAAVACTITGNLVSGNIVHGIFLSSTGAGGVSITKNFIGVDVTGSLALANGSDGVSISGPNITIGGATPEAGNLISGNGRGVYAVMAPGLVVQGNRIGADVSGAFAIPNTGGGMTVESCPGAKIGGTTASARNLVSGNGSGGVSVSSSSSVTLQGNYIGVDGSGTFKLANGGAGLQFNGGSTSLIGGTTTGAGNVISGNAGDGVQLLGCSTVSVQGNFIGVDAAGTAKIGNAGNGLFLLTTQKTMIGGAAGGTNLIADNGGTGIFIGFNSPFGSNTISANNIGTGKTGLESFGNAKHGVEIFGSSNNLLTAGNLIVNNGESGVVLRGGTTGNTIRANAIGLNGQHGVLIIEGASKNTIGGVGPGDGNTINANGTSGKGHGVEIESGTQNQIRRNSIAGNKGRGIDLNNDAVTPNDPGGENAGDASKANLLQDYPVLVYRQQGPADTGFHTWKLNSRPNETFTLEFFSNPSLDPTQHGEGEAFFLSDTVTTDAKGNATLGVNHTGRMQVTATATDKDGNTSEFALVDTDADGLADAWELAGLDVNEDGAVDLDLPTLGAKRLHKDIFVEVDAMAGRAPTQADLDLAASDAANSVGFAFAPDGLVHNPDQLDGIKLHAKLDDTDISLAAFGKSAAAYWGSFDAIKNTTLGTDGRAGSFGSTVDRADTNWTHIRAARLLVYRYCLFADRFGGASFSGIGELSDDGWGTNDFMVTIRPTAWGGATGVDRAGTFMHELGHTLGLRHGGGDNVNNKPNYHSVMNYTWQVPNGIRRTIASKLPDTSASWRLDYSRTQLATLDEAKLNEPAGIGGTAGFQVPYGQATIDINGNPRVTVLGLANETGAVNWNFQNGAGENPVAPPVDINFDGIVGQKLTGHEDWSNVQFYFREAAEFGTAHGAEDLDMPLVELPPPVVESVTINDGSPQRSRVTSLTIAFDQVVHLPPTPEAAFTLVRQSDSQPVNLTAVVADSELRTSVTLTFSGAVTESGSLKDGRYTLSVLAGAVSNAWGNLDGNADGTGGDDFALASAAPPDSPTHIFRLFGDVNGDGFTDNVDLIAYRAANGSDSTMMNYNAAFDSNGDGFIDNVDFIAFRQRLGMTP